MGQILQLRLAVPEALDEEGAHEAQVVERRHVGEAALFPEVAQIPALESGDWRLIRALELTRGDAALTKMMDELQERLVAVDRRPALLRDRRVDSVFVEVLHADPCGLKRAKKLRSESHLRTDRERCVTCLPEPRR